MGGWRIRAGQNLAFAFQYANEMGIVDRPGNLFTIQGIGGYRAYHLETRTGLACQEGIDYILILLLQNRAGGEGELAARLNQM